MEEAEHGELMSPSSPMIREAASAEQDDILHITVETSKERLKLMECFRTINSRLILNQSVPVGQQVVQRGSVLIAISDASILDKNVLDCRNHLYSMHLPVSVQVRPTGLSGCVLDIHVS